MLRRFSSLRPRRPRFPEGKFVPWSGLGFVGATCSLALGLTLSSAGRVSADHWQAVALLTALAALTPLLMVYALRRRISVVSLTHNSAAIALAASATSLLAHASSGLAPVPRALGLLLAI